VKPASFRYFAPTTVDEALSLLAEYGDEAKVLAGGQSLVPMMNFRLVSPAVIVDLNRVAELDYVREQDGGLAIGAMARQRRLERDALVAARTPLVAEAMPFVAHPQIRNRGTVGGSLAHADPAAELPAVVVALDARLLVTSKQGERWICASDFFRGLFTTALAPTELLTQIVLPSLPPRSGYSFQEVSRRHGDYALAGVACTITLSERNICTEARIIFLGLGAQPIDARGAAKQLIGNVLTDDAIRAAANAVDGEIDPGSDIHASAEFRRHLAKVLMRRALEKAVARIQ
jgi:aerobic carbon-monoxide dehydrogenase medium subunit